MNKMAKPRRSSPGHLVEQFCQDTDFHGLSRCVDHNRRNRYLRTAWAVLFTACFVFLCYLGIGRLRHYLHYPTSTTLSLSTAMMPLPVMSICTERVDKRLWQEDRLTLDDLLNFKSDFGLTDVKYVKPSNGKTYIRPDVLAYFTWLQNDLAGRITVNRTIVPSFFPGINYFEEDRLRFMATLIVNGSNNGELSVGEKSLRKSIIETSFTAKDLISDCTWASGGANGTCDVDDMKHVVTSVGNCYTVNFGNRSSPQYSLPFEKARHSKNSILKDNFVQIKIAKSLQRHAVKRTVKVIFHELEDFPDPALNDVQIVLKQFVRRIVKFTKVTNWTSLGPPYGEDCAENANTPYSWSQCVAGCMDQELLKVYNCTFFYLPSHSKEPLCDYSFHSRIALNDGTPEIFPADIVGVRNISLNCRESCLNPCCRQVYFYQIEKRSVFGSYAQLDLEPIGTLVMEHITTEPLYPGSALLAEVGGLMGVLVGGSILTVVHLGEFLVELVAILMGSYCHTQERGNMPKRREAFKK